MTARQFAIGFFFSLPLIAYAGARVCDVLDDIRAVRRQNAEFRSVDDFALWTREMGRTAAYPPGRAQ